MSTEPNRFAGELSALRKSIDAAIGHLSRLSFDKENFRHQLEIGFALSVIERIDAVHALVSIQKTYDADIILRSALEHFVTLTRVQQDPSYVWDIQAEFLKKRRIQFTQAKEGNPFFKSIAESLPIDDELEETEKKIVEVRELGGRIRSTTDNFQKVGAHLEYESVYRSLSDQIHPTYAGILARHFEVDEDQKDFSVVSFAIPPEEATEAVLFEAKRMTEKISEFAQDFK
ncbi:DUF5677 domain-containing protein [Roseobacteraceae bacterium NS-SX3]